MALSGCSGRGRVEYGLSRRQRKIDKALHKGGSPRSLGDSQGSTEQGLAGGGCQGEQVLLQLSAKWALSFLTCSSLGGDFCHQPFQEFLSFPESRKDHVVDHFGSFLPSPPQGPMVTSVNIATGFLLISTRDPSLTLLSPLDPVSPVQTWRGCERVSKGGTKCALK